MSEETADYDAEPTGDTSNPQGDTRTWAWVAVGSGAAMVIGSLLPWYVARFGFGQVSVAGTEGDGVFTLIIGAGAAAFGGWVLNRGPARRLLSGIFVGAMILAVLIVGYHVTGQSIPADAAESASIGSGAWVALLGSLAGLASSVQLWRSTAL